MSDTASGPARATGAPPRPRSRVRPRRAGTTLATATLATATLAAATLAGLVLAAAAPPGASGQAPSRQAPARLTPARLTPARQAPATSGPCGRTVRRPRYRHVIWVVMENAPYQDVISSPSAPFVTRLARRCGVADHYEAVAHPSLPNYLALAAGRTFSVADDAPPSAHRISAPSIFSELDAAHRTWRAYDQAMSRPCQQVSAGRYAVKHNPAAYFVNLRGACARDDVAMGPLTTGRLAAALRRGRLASFSFVTPDVCDDGHSCPLAVADDWLRRFFAVATRSRSYRDGHLAIFVTWDEGSGADQRVVLLAVAPSVPAGTVATGRFDHYGLLRTTEQLLGVPAIGRARGAASMVAAFHL